VRGWQCQKTWPVMSGEDDPEFEELEQLEGCGGGPAAVPIVHAQYFPGALG